MSEDAETDRKPRGDVAARDAEHIADSEDQPHRGRLPRTMVGNHSIHSGNRLTTAPEVEAGLTTLFASAVYPRLPPTAAFHCRPPAVPPGPAVVFHTSSPVSGSSAQWSPLF